MKPALTLALQELLHFRRDLHRHADLPSDLHPIIVAPSDATMIRCCCSDRPSRRAIRKGRVADGPLDQGSRCCWIENDRDGLIKQAAAETTSYSFYPDVRIIGGISYNPESPLSGSICEESTKSESCPQLIAIRDIATTSGYSKIANFGSNWIKFFFRIRVIATTPIPA